MKKYLIFSLFLFFCLSILNAGNKEADSVKVNTQTETTENKSVDHFIDRNGDGIADNRHLSRFYSDKNENRVRRAQRISVVRPQSQGTGSGASETPQNPGRRPNRPGQGSGGGGNNPSGGHGGGHNPGGGG